MKDSNENHIFINEKLNKALKKSEERIDKLTLKIKTITNESVILPKQSLNSQAAANDDHFSPPPKVEKGAGATPEAGGFPEAGFGDSDGGDDIFGGDVSSIFIKAGNLDDMNLGV